ncbi:hypothetical protein EGW08_000588 [Elysia chlorotica]|uniref:Uncharacterized protein n=1 Tax=Elysia chlorotica TaxID=188477 RepID=A0A3S1BMC2_ELYCH|nr:hypothetical protein EGW08_000588 [Elysia chlorotica]
MHLNQGHRSVCSYIIGLRRKSVRPLSSSHLDQQFAPCLWVAGGNPSTKATDLQRRHIRRQLRTCSRDHAHHAVLFENTSSAATQPLGFRSRSLTIWSTTFHGQPRPSTYALRGRGRPLSTVAFHGLVGAAKPTLFISRWADAEAACTPSQRRAYHYNVHHGHLPRVVPVLRPGPPCTGAVKASSGSGARQFGGVPPTAGGGNSSGRFNNNKSYQFMNSGTSRNLFGVSDG